jgi:hypothetical protein
MKQVNQSAGEGGEGGIAMFFKKCEEMKHRGNCKNKIEIRKGRQ